MTVRPHVELLRTLDEKFLVDDAVFHHAQPTGTLLLTDDGLRRDDGTLDLELIERLVMRSVGRLPAMRLRLRTTPLALTTPAWVPVQSVDPARHLRIGSADGATRGALAAGQGNPGLDRRLPLWNAHVYDLGDGTIGLTLRVSHAVGDGMFGLRVLDAATDPQPLEGRPDALVLPPLTAPTTGIGVLVAAGRAWWEQFGPLPSAWREYWRKPYPKRLRRWGGRVRRAVRGVPRTPGRSTFPSLHHAFTGLDFSTVRSEAKRAGASVHDLLISATLEALTLERSAPAVLDVPISRRIRSSGAEGGNHITMTRVGALPGTPFAGLLEGTATAIGNAVEGRPPAEVLGRATAYASYLPWSVRRRYFGRAATTALVLWPVLGAHHEIALFGTSHAGTFTLAASGPSEERVEAVLRSVAARMLGQAP